MRWILVVAAMCSFELEVARACDPIDAPVLLAVMGGDFVFVNADTLTRVRADGTVVLTKEVGFVSQDIAVMPDGRHLLNPVPDGYTGMCLGDHIDLQVIDTTTRARSRSLGTFPTGPREAASVRSMRTVGNAMEVGIGAMLDGGERWESELVRVTPTRATRRRRVREPPEHLEPTTEPTTGSTPARPPLDRLAPLEAHSSAWGSERRWVRIRSGSRNLVTIALTRHPLGARFSPDGTRLAIATYEQVNEDYGTGYSARLDLIDLASGAVQTPVGETSGVTGVQGRVELQCSHRVADPDSPLNVRRAPRSAAPVVGTVPHETSVEVGETRGSWIQLRAPVRGWAWAENIERHCTVR